MTLNVNLTAEMERFAQACVDSGRYESIDDVLRSGLRLLQEMEERRQHLNRMLADVEAEADRHGTHSLDDVLAEVDEIISARAR